MKLQDAINIFTDQYKPSTRRTYVHVLGRFADWIGTSRPIADINNMDMLRYTNTIRNSDYARATQWKHIKSLKTFFNWLVKNRVITESPLKTVQNLKLEQYIGREKALSEEQYNHLIAHLDRNQQRYIRHRALILFLADTGCRAGGAAGLCWSDVDLESMTAKVTEKGDKSRPVFFFEFATAAIRKWQGHQQREKGDHVFSQDGGKITSSSISQLFRRTCISAGIGSHGTHKLRHRKAHQLVDAGVNPSIASTVIGDTTEMFIKHYAPKDFESARAAARTVAHRPSQVDENIIPIQQRKLK